jgi:tetratricopeptide (TPR) repeat protein
VSGETVDVVLELEPSDGGFADHAVPSSKAGMSAGESNTDEAEADDLELELELDLELSEEGFVEHASVDAQITVDALLVQELQTAMIAEGELADAMLPESAVAMEMSLAEEPKFVKQEGVPFGEFVAEEAAASASNDVGSPDIIFSAVRKGLDQQLDKEDTETHYNLGIAFMEMGLYDDAITEFQAAARDPKRTADCITSQGICCRDKGDYSRAEEIFTKGLALPGLVAEESASIKYELALLYETAGRNEDALLLYREIHAVNRGFRDTAKKIAGFSKEETQEFYDLDLIEPDDELE